MKRLAKVLVSLAMVGVAALLLSTFFPRPFISQPAQDNDRVRRIVVLSNPIHTDIAVPIDEVIRRRFAFLADAGLPLDAPGARYLLFGRGGRDFYINTPTWSELKLGPLLKGVTLDQAVLHVDVIGAFDEQIGMPLDLPSEGFESMAQFIDDSFSRPAGIPVVIAGARYGEYDAFYEATGTFTALLGCNTWTAAALRAGGVRTGWWNPLPASLRWSVALFNPDTKTGD